LSDGRTILLVSPYRAEYGPREVLHHVADALAARGHRIVCAVPAATQVAPELRERADAVHEVEGLGTVPRTLNVIRLGDFAREHLAASREIERIARAERAEAVYSASEAILAGSLAGRRLGVPTLVHAIGMSIRSPRWTGAAYVRTLSRLTDRFVACSSAVAEMLAGFGIPDDRLTVAHNGVSVSAIDTADAAAPDVRRPAVGMFAAYDPRKGHELFIAAAEAVAAHYPEARFYIVGGSLSAQPESLAFERRIERMIERLGLGERVVRVDFVPRPEVFGWIRAMDVVVVPSRTEAFAHALLEAMVCARPVVATAVEGNLDAFVDGQSGVYVPRTPSALASAVTTLIDDPDRRERMGQAARERASRFFDVSVSAPAIANAVDLLLAEAGARHS
jgi:D-inositol-3-phosphate glycosyltransferase